MIVATLLFISTASPLTVFAVEDSILGVSIDKFNGVMSAKGAVETTKDEFKSYADNPGYIKKLTTDTLHYRLEIIKIANELGTNYSELIPEHIKSYNSLLVKSLTDEYEIKATIEDDGTYTIESTEEETLNYIKAIIGESSDDSKIEDDSSIWSQLNALEEASEKYADNEDGLKDYYTENISTIRYLMTSIKDMYTHFSSEMELGEDLKNKFISVYDAIAKFALENDMQALANLNLFGDTIGFDITAEGEELLEYVADWEEISEDRLNQWASGKAIDGGLPTEMLKTYSEYMLKNIAASSTFKPFETNLNSVEPFSFLGEESKVFHELLGTSRKMLLSPTEGNNTLNFGMNLELVQDLKLLTLRDFVENPKGNKIIYVDNLQYSVSDIETVQGVVSGNIQDVGEEGTGNEVLDDLAETTQSDNGKKERGWMGTAWNWVSQKWGDTVKGTNSLGGGASAYWKMVSSVDGYFSDGSNASTLLFAKGDVENMYNIEEHVDKRKREIVMSNLIYTNIMEEYWNYGSRLKLSKDMDKPLFVDIYGNIVTASGVVVLPSLTNPYLNSKTGSTLLFTRAFIESYPSFTVKGGNIAVNHSDRNKLALFGQPMSDDEIDIDIKASEFDYKDSLTEVSKAEDNPDTNSALEEDELSNSLTTAFIEQDIAHIPGVKFYVGKAENGELGKYKHPTRNLKPIAYKFNNDYEPVKSLDLFSFGKKNDGTYVDSYYELRDSLGQVSGMNGALLINEYTVKLSFDEGDSHTVTFKDFPNSNEIKRYMYLVNLEHLAKVKDGSLVEKNPMTNAMKITTTEALFKGVANTSMLNSLVPEYIETFFTTIKNLNIDKANDRYNSALKGNVDNNIVYIKNIEEIDSIKKILPVVYKGILLVSIIAVILNIIMFAISNEGKFSRIFKILVILYIVTFLFIVMPKAFTSMVNSPMKMLFKEELMHWTLIEQEKMSNTSLIESNGDVKVAEDTYSSSLKLYEVKYSSPFSIFQRDSYMNIDEFYGYYVNNDAVFQTQSTPMYMDGKFLTIDTETIFDSSSVVIDDVENPLMKVRHDVYGNPEFAFYLPYYMIVDNLVYNLNNITDVTKKVPRDLVYSNGDRKTSGRFSNWVNSSLFLDYEDFLERVASFEAGDKISAELAVADVEEMIAKYGDPSDFLGLGKILGQPTVLKLKQDDELHLTDEDDTSLVSLDPNADLVVESEISDEASALEPFTETGLAKIQNTGWYPNNFDKAKQPRYKELFAEKITKVNEKTKKFMLELGDISRNVSDESLIKTVALYASIEFNKEFNSFATNKGPTGIELNNLPIERLMMSLTLPREELIDNSITSYPNQLLDNAGYMGLTLGVFNDFLLIFINSIKPFIIVCMWAVVGIVIFVKKVLLPDHKNSSIMGSIKLLILFVIATLVYSVGLVVVIKIVNVTDSPFVGILLSLVANLSYALGLMYIAFVMIKDLWNLGSAMTLGSLDKAMAKMKLTARNAVSLVPFMDRVIPGLNDTGRPIPREVKTGRDIRTPLSYPDSLPTDYSSPKAVTEPTDFSAPMSKLEGSERISKGEYFEGSSLTELNKTGRKESDNLNIVQPISNPAYTNPRHTDRNSSDDVGSLNDSALEGGTSRVNENVRPISTILNSESTDSESREYRGSHTVPIDTSERIKTQSSNKNKED